MRPTPQKRKQSAERKYKSTINNSKSKALYSFSKAQRFPDRNYKSVTNIRFYDVQVKKYDRKISFTTGKRTQFAKRDGVPGPTRYNTISDFRQKKQAIQFKAGRDQCKSNSVFQTNQNPSPNKYYPKTQTKFKTIFYSLGRRIQMRNKQAQQIPGPIYNIQSTMLDQNKHLSIYIKRNSTKICQPRTCFSRKTKERESTIIKEPSKSQHQFITSRGGRQLGQSGPYPKQSQAKRLFQRDIKQSTPGPGYYRSFSQFVEDNVEVC